MVWQVVVPGWHTVTLTYGILIAPLMPVGPLSTTMAVLLLSGAVTLSAALALTLPPSPVQDRV